MSSGANVTALLNGIISSGYILMEPLIEELNQRFGNLAEFSYQSQFCDGEEERVILIGPRQVLSHPQIEDTKQVTSRSDQHGNYFVYKVDMEELKMFDKRVDSVSSLHFSNRFATMELGEIMSRWPARVQLISAALSSIFKSYTEGEMIILDSVRLSNGMVYNIEEAWSQRQYLKPEEAAAISVVKLYGTVLDQTSFKEALCLEETHLQQQKVFQGIKVYWCREKDPLYKY